MRVIRFVFLFLPFVYLIILLSRIDISLTQDLGRHLLLGEMIINCRCIPDTNLFSYTATTHPFINHHWLSEVIFFVVQKTFSLPSLLLLKSILILIAWGMTVFSVYKKAQWMWITTLSIPYLYILSERFDTRPELFSFVCIALFMVLLSKAYHKGFTPWLYILVIAEILWVNLHIYFIIGLIVYLFFLISQLFLYRSRIDKRYFVLLILLIGAAFVNPHSIQGVLLPFTIFKDYGYSIVENQSLIFLNQAIFNPRILVIEIISGFLVILTFMQKKSISLFHLLLTVFAVVSVFIQIRNIPLFVFITFPLFVQYVTDSEKVYEKKLSPSFIHTIRGCMFFVMIVFAVFHSVSSFTDASFGWGYSDPAKDATDFIKDKKLPHAIFNNFDIGSYLIYRLYPEYKVYVDGRPEAYPSSFFNKYIKMQEESSFFEKQIQYFSIRTVVFAYTDITPWAREFLSAISQNKQWVLIYLQDGIAIFIKSTPDTQALISQYKIEGVRFSKDAL